MSRKKKKCCHGGGRHGYPWQSSELNTRSYIMYRDWIMSLAMSRYRWIGLPESCDARYLEWTLITQGVATIAKSKEGVWASTQAATLSPPNVYDNYTHWQSFGNNGWNFPVTPLNGVLVWDNRLRFPCWNQIDLFARRLAKLDRAFDCNVQQQLVTKIICAPQEMQNDITQVYKQNAGGEPGILGVKGLMQDIEVNVLGMEVDFIGEQLQKAKDNVWSEVHDFLGIANIQHKSERMITDELNAENAPTDLRAMDGLFTRRQACKELNELHGLEVQVYWFEDYETDNYNMVNTVRELEGLKNV